MTPIQKNDIVGLAKSISPELPQGLVGRVLHCDKDTFHVQFPLPGNLLHAQVPQESIRFLVGGFPYPFTSR